MDPLEEWFEGMGLGKERGKSGTTKPKKQGPACCILRGRMLNMTVVSFSESGIHRLQPTCFYMAGKLGKQFTFLYGWKKNQRKNTVDP